MDSPLPPKDAPAPLRPAQVKNFPVTIPLFPLRGVVIFPGASVPLLIFESRYLNMLEDVLATGRWLGMIQPLDAREDDPHLYEVGTLVRVVAFRELEEGRMGIQVQGQCRFRVACEQDMVRGYRTAQVSYDAFVDDVLLEMGQASISNRTTLLEIMWQYFRIIGMEMEDDRIEGVNDMALVVALCMQCPFEAREKQALLESESGQERATLLQDLMDMAVRSAPYESALYGEDEEDDENDPPDSIRH